MSRILGQDYAGPIECIVVFDKSEVTPIDVATSETRRLHLMANDRRPGLAGARNSGILASTGALIAFCDDDDEWLPGKVVAQTELLEAHPETAVVGCHIALNGSNGRITRPDQVTAVDFDALLRSRVFELHPSTIMARRDRVIDDIGLVDEELPGSYAEDYDWVLRAARHAPILLVDTPLVRITWQTGSLFANRWNTISDALVYLLDKHPEFAVSHVGSARIEAQIAFANAALGRRRASARWAFRALRHDPLQPRAYLALAVDSRLVRLQRVLRAVHRRGIGI